MANNERPVLLVDSYIPYIEGRLEDCAEVHYLKPEEFTPERVRDADGLIIRTRTHCDKELLDGSKVKFIATATIGTDHIDLDYCKAHGIDVRNAPGCNAPGVAQYVWSALMRMGFEPGKHKLGVVGAGNVGGLVAAWGRLAGTEVVVSDPPRQEAGLEDNYMPLPQLLAECDAVTLHTPLTTDGKHPTHHLIDTEALSLMKPGAILVNAARGPVVDINALRESLTADRIRAVVDTWEYEPETDKDVLRLADYATFHIAGYSSEGKQRATRMAIEAVNEAFDINGDTSGLTQTYVLPDAIGLNRVAESYDPGVDTAMLREHPDEFDALRNSYHYRDEA